MSDASKNQNVAAEACCCQAKSIWDNNLPPGESPPLPKWPLTASIVAYSVWMVFLVAMMIVRLTTT